MKMSKAGERGKNAYSKRKINRIPVQVPVSDLSLLLRQQDNLFVVSMNSLACSQVHQIPPQGQSIGLLS